MSRQLLGSVALAAALLAGCSDDPKQAGEAASGQRANSQTNPSVDPATPGGAATTPGSARPDSPAPGGGQPSNPQAPQATDRAAPSPPRGEPGPPSGEGWGTTVGERKPTASSEQYEQRSWAQLGQWWPYRPLLQSSAPAGTTEHTYAWSHKGGTKADPKTNNAAVMAIYDTPAATVQTSTPFEIVLAGGYAFSAMPTRAAAENPPGQNPREVDIGRGTALESYAQVSAGQTLRFTQWVEGDSFFFLLTKKEAHSDAAVRRFIDSLRPQ